MMKIRANICDTLMVIFLATALASCTDSEKGRAATGKTKSKSFEEIPGWIGIYQDTLPCEDCPGLLTWLEIFANGQYKRISTKTGFEDALSNTFSEKGKWIFNPNTTVLQLQDSLTGSQLFLQPKGDSALILCKADGGSFQGGGWKLRRRNTGAPLPKTGVN